MFICCAPIACKMTTLIARRTAELMILVVSVVIDVENFIEPSIIRLSWLIFIKNVVNAYICDTLRSRNKYSINIPYI